MQRKKSVGRRKVSVMFPVDLLRKVKLLSGLRQEPMSQTIVWLTGKALDKEFGLGEVNLEVLDRMVGSVPAGGDAVKDAEEIYD